MFEEHTQQGMPYSSWCNNSVEPRNASESIDHGVARWCGNKGWTAKAPMCKPNTNQSLIGCRTPSHSTNVYRRESGSTRVWNPQQRGCAATPQRDQHHRNQSATTDQPGGRRQRWREQCRTIRNGEPADRPNHESGRVCIYLCWIQRQRTGTIGPLKFKNYG